MEARMYPAGSLMECCHSRWAATHSFYSRLSMQMHAVAIHRASMSDNSTYRGMLISSNAGLSSCPELAFLAVRPVTRGVCSEASMVALLP